MIFDEVDRKYICHDMFRRSFLSFEAQINADNNLVTSASFRASGALKGYAAPLSRWTGEHCIGPGVSGRAPRVDFAHLKSLWRFYLRRLRMPDTQFSSASISALRSSGPGTSARAAAAWSWPGSHFEHFVMAASRILQSSSMMSAILVTCCV